MNDVLLASCRATNNKTVDKNSKSFCFLSNMKEQQM